MKSKDVVLEHLGAIPLFGACTDRQLKQVRGLLDEVNVPAGKVLVKEGGTGYECFIIVSGHAEVSIGDEVISRFGEGEYFGELALLDKRPRSATVTATTDCTVMVLTQRESPRRWTPSRDCRPRCWRTWPFVCENPTVELSNTKATAKFAPPSLSVL